MVMPIGATETMAVTPAAAPAAAPPAGAQVSEIPSTVVFDDERPRRRGFKVAVGVLLLVAGARCARRRRWALVRTKSYTVPDLVGVQEEIALNQISGNDWTTSTTIERSDE